jgi:predicted PurR-regulated permease PerM
MAGFAFDRLGCLPLLSELAENPGKYQRGQEEPGMSLQIGQSKTAAIFITSAACVILIAGMRAASPLLVPMFLAVFIAIVSAPPLFWLKKKGIPSVLAMCIVMVALLVTMVMLAALVGTSLDTFLRDMPEYQHRLQEKLSMLLAWLDAKGLDVGDRKLVEAFDPGVGLQLVTRIVTGLGNVLTNGFLIMLTVVFILLEASSFSDKIGALLDDPERSFNRLTLFFKNIQRYMAIKTVISIATGAAVALWLAVIGVDYALLWGIIAFLFNYIPNIGSILAAFPAVALALIQLGTTPAILAAAGYLVVNTVVGNIIEPRVMGRGLGLSTLVVFLSLVFWGWIFGPVGMLLSVPLTMTVKIALDGSDETRWIAVLLGEGKP